MTDEEALFSPKITHNGNVYVDKRPTKTQFKHERSNAVKVTVDGVSMTAAEWARQPGVTVGASGLIWRIRQGWNHYDAVYKKARLA